MPGLVSKKPLERDTKTPALCPDTSTMLPLFPASFQLGFFFPSLSCRFQESVCRDGEVVFLLAQRGLFLMTLTVRSVRNCCRPPLFVFRCRTHASTFERTFHSLIDFLAASLTLWRETLISSMLLPLLSPPPPPVVQRMPVNLPFSDRISPTSLDSRAAPQGFFISPSFPIYCSLFFFFFFFRRSRPSLTVPDSDQHGSFFF